VGEHVEEEGFDLLQLCVRVESLALKERRVHLLETTAKRTRAVRAQKKKHCPCSSHATLRDLSEHAGPRDAASRHCSQSSPGETWRGGLGFGPDTWKISTGRFIMAGNLVGLNALAGRMLVSVSSCMSYTCGVGLCQLVRAASVSYTTRGAGRARRERGCARRAPQARAPRFGGGRGGRGGAGPCS